MASSELDLMTMFREFLEERTTTRTSAESTVKSLPSRVERTGEGLLRAAGLRDIKTIEAGDATAAHHDEIVRELDRRAVVKASRKDVPDLLGELAERGFSWRDIARIAGVTVPAVRKWRTGGTHLADRRRELARVAGLCDLLDEYLVPQPAGWLEMPLRKGIPVTWMDLYLEGHEDLVVDAASHREDVDVALDKFSPDWRSRYATDFEVFEDTDGKPSVRAKRR